MMAAFSGLIRLAQACPRLVQTLLNVLDDELLETVDEGYGGMALDGAADGLGALGGSGGGGKGLVKVDHLLDDILELGPDDEDEADVEVVVLMRLCLVDLRLFLSMTGTQVQSDLYESKFWFNEESMKP